MKALLFFSTLFLFIACTNDQEQKQGEQQELTKEQKQIKALEKEVIDIHDEVMPKTADINRMQRKIKGLLKDSTLNEAAAIKLRDHLVLLTKADDGMNDWMRGYKKPSKDSPFEEVMTYLNGEKVKIQKVSDQMLESLKSGNELIENFQATESK